MHKFTAKLERGEDPQTGHPVFGVSAKDMFITDPFLSECGRFQADPVAAYGISMEDATALVALNKALKKATEDALNAGCLAIQEAMGIATGDVAGVYFSGDDASMAVARTFADYAAHELLMAQDD